MHAHSIRQTYHSSALRHESNKAGVEWIVLNQKLGIAKYDIMTLFVIALEKLLEMMESLLNTFCYALAKSIRVSSACFPSPPQLARPTVRSGSDQHFWSNGLGDNRGI